MEYSIENITEAAKHLVKASAARSIWDFQGEMGAGKTTLISAICDELKVEDQVSSPTFSIVNEYSSPVYGTIYHFDFYRIEDISEAMNIGLLEYLDSGKLCFLEWSSNVKSLLDHDVFSIRIEVLNPQNRKLTTAYGPS